MSSAPQTFKGAIPSGELWAWPWQTTLGKVNLPTPTRRKSEPVTGWSGHKAKASSSKPQAPGKLQIPSSNVPLIRRRSSVWAQPDRWPAYLTRGIWNSELGASLELGVWLLEVRFARIY